MWWGPVISQQFLWHHSCTIYLLNNQQAAICERVSEQVSEWVFFKENEEEDLCHIGQALCFLHDIQLSGTYSYSVKEKVRRKMRLWRVSWALGQCGYTRQASLFSLCSFSFIDATDPDGIWWKRGVYPHIDTQTHRCVCCALTLRSDSWRHSFILCSFLFLLFVAKLKTLLLLSGSNLLSLDNI